MSASNGYTAPDLSELLEAGNWLKLPIAAMHDVGPAVQTLGGVLALTCRETFASVEDIAIQARLRMPTVRKHLTTLWARGWLDKLGRQPTRTGRPRRTCTWRVTKKTRNQLREYLVLPSAAASDSRLTWSARAVYSVVMTQAMKLKGAAEIHYEDLDCTTAIEEMGGDDRFRFSIRRLMRDTGLSRQAVIDGKAPLAKYGYIKWYGDRDTPCTPTDILLPVALEQK